MIPTLPCRAIPARDWDRLPLADRASACQSCIERAECYELGVAEARRTPSTSARIRDPDQTVWGGVPLFVIARRLQRQEVASA